ncbi:hypothetical protein JCM33374_g4401 [Metschnikowia sp. JCM 33374]|nr:hypothetical protein JCM33374_g4401 [Metschnikowia sp. JCM 33374]
MPQKEGFFVPPTDNPVSDNLQALVRKCLRQRRHTQKLRLPINRSVAWAEVQSDMPEPKEKRLRHENTKSESVCTQTVKTYYLSIPRVDRWYAVRPYETTQERIWRESKNRKQYSARVVSRLSSMLAEADELETGMETYLQAREKALRRIQDARHRLRRISSRILKHSWRIDAGIAQLGLKPGSFRWSATKTGFSVLAKQKLLTKRGIAVENLRKRASKLTHSVIKHNKLVNRSDELQASIWTPYALETRSRTEHLWNEIKSLVLDYDITGHVALGGLALHVLEGERVDATKHEQLLDSTDDEPEDEKPDLPEDAQNGHTSARRGGHSNGSNGNATNSNGRANSTGSESNFSSSKTASSSVFPSTVSDNYDTSSPEFDDTSSYTDEPSNRMTHVAKDVPSYMVTLKAPGICSSVGGPSSTWVHSRHEQSSDRKVQSSFSLCLKINKSHLPSMRAENNNGPKSSVFGCSPSFMVTLKVPPNNCTNLQRESSQNSSATNKNGSMACLSEQPPSFMVTLRTSTHKNMLLHTDTSLNNWEEEKSGFNSDFSDSSPSYMVSFKTPPGNYALFSGPKINKSSAEEEISTNLFEPSMTFGSTTTTSVAGTVLHVDTEGPIMGCNDYVTMEPTNAHVKCPFCASTLSYPETMKPDVIESTPQMEFPCGLCGGTFKSLARLYHQQEVGGRGRLSLPFDG